MADEVADFTHIDGVGPKAQKVLEELGSHEAIVKHGNLEDHLKSKKIHRANIEEIRNHALSQLEKEGGSVAEEEPEEEDERKKLAEQSVREEEELRRQQAELVEMQKSRADVGKEETQLQKLLRQLKAAEEELALAEEWREGAVREGKQDLNREDDLVARKQNKVQSIKNTLKVGGYDVEKKEKWGKRWERTKKGAKISGKVLKAPFKVAGFLGRTGLAIKKTVEREQKGSLDWLIWTGLIVHFLYWYVFDFNPGPTYVIINYVVMYFILIKNYNLLVIDRRKFGIFAAIVVFYNYIIPTFGNMYPWFHLVQTTMVFVFVALLSESWVGAAFFLQLGGLNLIGSYYPQLNVGVLALLFMEVWWWAPWWSLLASFKSESHLAHKLSTLYFFVVLFMILSGSTPLYAGINMQKDKSVAEQAELEFEKATQDSLGTILKECGSAAIRLNIENIGKKCGRVINPSIPLEDEEELFTEGGIDKSIEEEVTTEWFTEKESMSAGEEASTTANLYVTSLYDVGIDVECGVKGKKDSGNANPNNVKISASIVGEEKPITCKIKKENLKEGSNTVVFGAKVLGSQLNVKSRYVFYAIEGNYLERKEDEFLSNEKEREIFYRDKKNLGSALAKLVLYEQRFLPNIIDNIEDKIRTDYPDYLLQNLIQSPRNRYIESKSEPGFVKVNVNVGFPFIGIKKNMEIPLSVSAENRVQDGKILAVNSGSVEMPLWLSPSKECDILDTTTEVIDNSRHTYQIKEDKLDIDWTKKEYGFKNRERFEPCPLKVNKDPSLIDGFDLFDLNGVEITVELAYDFEIEATSKLYVEKGALEGIA